LFDNGPGIAAAYLEHIFDSFFSTKDTGIDIGLAICQSNTAMVAASRIQTVRMAARIFALRCQRR